MASIDPGTFENNPITSSSLPKVEVLDFSPLSPKYLTKRTISTSISLGAILVLAVAGQYFFPEVSGGYFPLGLVLLVLYLGWRYLVNYQWQKRTGYALRERDIVYKRGFLFEKTTAVPFNRVQHVSTRRGILDKMLGLSSLLVFTAGGSGSDISIPGLTPELADSLKEALAKRISDHV